MFFFSSRRRHTRCLSDWSSDVCSSDLQASGGALRAGSDAPYPVAFRELGRRGLAGMPILLVLTDLVIGRQADEDRKSVVLGKRVEVGGGRGRNINNRRREG